jgi:hypothetical protein
MGIIEIITVHKIFLLQEKIKKDNLFLFGNLIILCLTCLISFGFGNFIDLSIDNELSSETIITFLYIFIASIVFFKSFLPIYQPLVRTIPEILPIRKIKSFGLDIYVDFTSLFFGYIFCFILILFFTSEYVRFSCFISFILIAISSHLLTRVIRTLIERKVNFRSKNLIMFWFIFCGISFIIMSYDLISFSFELYLAIALVYILLTDFIIELNSKVGFRSSKRIQKQKFLFIQLLLNNPLIRASIFVSFAIKIVFLGANIGSYRDTGQALFQVNYIEWIFVSPLLLFTNVFNNLWGYHKSLWLANFFSNQSFKNIIIQILKLLWQPLLIDLVIFLVYLVLMEKFSGIMLITYFSTVITYTIFSLLASFIMPCHIGKSISFGTNLNTSYQSLIISLIILFISILIVSFSFGVYIILPLIILTNMILIIILIKRWNYKRYKLFKILFTE